MKKSPLGEPDEVPILTTIQKIKDKQLDPKLLSKQERQQCVEILMLDGFNEAQIGQVLGRSRKTIIRDLENIRKKHALIPSQELAFKKIGDMCMSAAVHRAHLMRLARKAGGSIQEQLQAEFMAWTIKKQEIELLQKLGYMPTHHKQLEGDFLI